MRNHRQTNFRRLETGLPPVIIIILLLVVGILALIPQDYNPQIEQCYKLEGEAIGACIELNQE